MRMKIVCSEEIHENISYNYYFFLILSPHHFMSTPYTHALSPAGVTHTQNNHFIPGPYTNVYEWVLWHLRQVELRSPIEIVSGWTVGDYEIWLRWSLNDNQ